MKIRHAIVFLLTVFTLTFSVHAQVYIYGYRDTRVYKADTLGNVYWVKNFAGKLVSSSGGTNKITLIFQDSAKVFVSVSQVDSFPSSTSIDIHSALFVLDTSGVILNSFQWSTYASDAGVISISKSIDNQYWMMFSMHINLSVTYQMIKMNSDGTFDSTSVVYNEGPGLVTQKAMRSLPDSSYFISVNVSSNLSGNFGIRSSRITKDGSILWSKGYDVTGHLWTHSIVIDSLMNVFYVGDYIYSGVNPDCTFGMKTDTAGNVMNSVFWPQLLYHSGKYHSLRIRNDSLIDVYRYTIAPGLSAEIYLDSQLNTACLTHSGLGVSTYNSTGAFNSSVPVAISCNFIPVNDTLTFQYHTPGTSQPQVYPDYCTVLSLPEEFSSEYFNVFPNPATDKLSVHFSGNSLQNISIYNITGTLVFQAAVQNEKTIDVSDIPNGLYFLKVDYENQLTGTTFLIQR